MVVGTLAIVVIIIILILWRRKQKQRDAVDNGFAVIKKGSITMRDRLRAESLKSLDSRLLRLYDPNKLRQYPLDHVSYIKDIGEGFFGKVFQGRLLRLPLNKRRNQIFWAHAKLRSSHGTNCYFPAACHWLGLGQCYARESTNNEDLWKIRGWWWNRSFLESQLDWDLSGKDRMGNRNGRGNFGVWLK